MQPVCKKVVVHDKIEEMGLKSKSKLTLRQGGGGKNLSINLTLSVQWVGMDSFPKHLLGSSIDCDLEVGVHVGLYIAQEAQYV